MNWRVEEMLNGIKVKFCRHDYIYETLDYEGFIFRCSKCGKGIRITYDSIERKLVENKLSPCQNYPISELHLPSSYQPSLVTYYRGRYVEKTICWFYRKYGVLISQYGIQKWGVSKEVREQP